MVVVARAARDAHDLLSESGGASKGEKTHAARIQRRLFMVELPFRVPPRIRSKQGSGDHQRR